MMLKLKRLLIRSRKVSLNRDIVTVDDLLKYIHEHDSSFNGINESLVQYFNDVVDGPIAPVKFRALLAKYMPAKGHFNIEYWVRRGYSVESGKEQIRLIQSKNARKFHDNNDVVLPNMIKYWVNRGYTEEQAALKVTEHQRKSSKRCVEYWLAKGYDEESAKQAVSDVQKANTETESYKAAMARPDRTETQIGYWLAKGYDEATSTKLLHERQVTFSYGVCVKKHGIQKGTEIFNARQIAWQNTLNSKSTEEKAAINFKKSKTGGLGIKKMLNSTTDLANKPGVVYYIRFYNESTEFWKVGICIKTSNDLYSVHKRFGEPEIFKAKYGLSYEVISTLSSNYYDCYLIEQSILRHYKDDRILVHENGFKSTECFSVPVFEHIQVPQEEYKYFKNMYDSKIKG